jgi:hypothetical protein
MWSMQYNVEFGYQLSICSGTKENLDGVGLSQDLLDANWLLASSPALNMQALTLAPICAVFFLFPPFIFFLWKHLWVVFPIGSGYIKPQFTPHREYHIQQFFYCCIWLLPGSGWHCSSQCNNWKINYC